MRDDELLSGDLDRSRPFRAGVRGDPQYHGAAAVSRAGALDHDPRGFARRAPGASCQRLDADGHLAARRRRRRGRRKDPVYARCRLLQHGHLRIVDTDRAASRHSLGIRRHSVGKRRAPLAAGVGGDCDPVGAARRRPRAIPVRRDFHGTGGAIRRYRRRGWRHRDLAADGRRLRSAERRGRTGRKPEREGCRQNQTSCHGDEAQCKACDVSRNRQPTIVFRVGHPDNPKRLWYRLERPTARKTSI